MLNIVNVGYDSTNHYVIETEATKLLVDVGFPGTLPKLSHALKRTGIGLAAIPYLLINHYHPDHAGLAQELKQQGLKLIVLEPLMGAYRRGLVRKAQALKVAVERGLRQAGVSPPSPCSARCCARTSATTAISTCC